MVKRFLRNNGLSLSLAALFLLFWCGQAVSGFSVRNDDARLHDRPSASFGEYLMGGHFWQATGENWESESLQMGAYVIMTVGLYQKGSAESNDPDKPESVRSSVRRRRRSWLYRHSLGLAFIGLFIVSFVIHARGGLIEFNEERIEHRQTPVSITGFLTNAEFWFQSFQNWQSEFLAVFSIVVLTIFLRQEGSPESKSVDDPDSKTGS